MSSPSQTLFLAARETLLVPSNLRRFQQAKDLHFITIITPSARTVFEHALERTRTQYRFSVIGYVVMPEHIHLLVSEPETKPLATALQALKQSVSRTVALRNAEPFWQARYYDFNVWTEKKHIEKLRCIHRNPVVRRLVAKPEDWPWSSFRHHATGVEGPVEIESRRTARLREGAQLLSTGSSRPADRQPRRSQARTGHPVG